MRKKTLILLTLVFAATFGAGAATELPTFTLGSPRPATVRATSDASANEWLAANPVFVATAGFCAFTNAVSDATSPDRAAYVLLEGEAGFSWERSKPEYYLSDRLDAPGDVDWHATYANWQDEANKSWAKGFLFNPDESDPCVYAITGGNQAFEWVLKDGSTNKLTYVVAMSYAGRPRRVYWTDSPYNGPKISLAGKFVKFMGNDELLTLRYGVVTNVSGSVQTVTEKQVVSGLYMDPASQTLCAAGQLSGQCVMVYYDTGNYDNILHVQVVEVRSPEATPLKGTIGEALKPDGQGYSTDGLTAQVAAGLGDATDDRGDYLYQHKGTYSHSPKNGNVYPLRPTVGARWLASVYWMETDAMNVQWPFEYDQYECDWPEDAQVYVRGDLKDAKGALDYGAKIYIDTSYSATLESYQEPDGHAVAVSGDNAFYTTGAGYSLLRLTADDNIWFLPVHSVLRSDTNLYTLAASRIAVGRELTLRAGSRSGLARLTFTKASADEPGYVYKAASGSQYDANLYHEKTSASTNTVSADSTSNTNLVSSIYAISTDEKPIEVWWSERVKPGDDAPAAIAVPVLPQVYRPVWPEDGEMPQIVIASQRGSANETVYQQNGAAYFDDEYAMVVLSDRIYFPSGAGTVSFWTRPAMFASDGLAVTNAPCPLLALGLDNEAGGKWPVLSVAIEAGETLVVRRGGATLLSAPMPRLRTSNAWTHLAVVFDAEGARLLVDGVRVAEAEDPVLGADLSGFVAGNVLGYCDNAPSGASVTPGRQVAELAFRSRALADADVASTRFDVLTGGEGGLTGYYTFRKGTDLEMSFQASLLAVATCLERVHGESCLAYDVVCTEPGAPARGTGVITADTTPAVYRQNDPGQAGYNPNDEHAFLTSGSGGYVTWALRSDLGTDATPPPAVFVEYGAGGKGRLQMFDVRLTNETWRALGADCTAGTVLPGPHPLDMMDDPWLAEDYFDPTADGRPGAAYRDRKGQLWARAAGTLRMHMYYAMQDGFDFPQLPESAYPAVGAAVPWLALLDKDTVTGANRDPRTASPAAWTWNVSWPEDVPEMKIGQTLTTAADGLPEVWNAKSMAVVYPDPDVAEKTVLLADPTVVQSVAFAYDDLAALGLSTDKNGGLAQRAGKIYFTELPPHLSSRLYLDTSTDKLCFMGERKSSAAGASVLYPNVLSDAERALVLALVPADCRKGAAYTRWQNAVAGLATAAVRPNAASVANAEIFTGYSAADHYALAAMGATNYVTLIENDATNKTLGVTSGDAVGMHVVKVVPEYYTGRIVTREDEVNLLSQQLSVVYTESFLGEADDYVFEWRKARPSSSGAVPTDYEGYSRKYDPDRSDEGVGNVRLTIGGQGDTLANMVNTYWICRYRAKDASAPSYSVMSNSWSAWCAPPALAEGWVQRVLNNVTPFNQRMTDLYENKAETAISMIQIAGRPYTGDVALNQDNLTSVGLIELYETILNKAESLSLRLGINDTDANKQLLLAVERLQDLYALLGDEAYADAKNPTIGIGSNKAYQGDNRPEVDFASLSSALFCFDNQVSSLLDEELALLRGRTGESAPVVTTAPYYNRLVWNFTKGITAGEVAYAVNYNIEGTETTALSEEQAAVLYPQGHGDAYGHYLSALKGWYRLIRNPNFTWPVAQGEMVVADSTVNVDYYEEAKFAEAAAKLAKTAADCVDLTARKACRDSGGALAGYVDEDATRAFGYGEWAARGGYGALVNWVAANSLLPVDATTLAKDEVNADFSDGALARIDRGTVDELSEICESAARVQGKLDALDAGMNPLGLSDGAIPFDITPIGASDGSKTHYEQIRERAGTALANARAVLDRAQESSNRLRMLQEANDSYAAAIEKEELAYKQKLIGYYGTPYSDDIGPGKTYAQGYDGPDLLHYMWMDLSKFGLTEIDDTRTYETVYYSGLAGMVRFTNVITALWDDLSSTIRDAEKKDVIVYERSANGLVVKPDSITGRRQSQGTIQEKYAEFLQAYAAARTAETAHKYALEKLEIAITYDTAVAWVYFSIAGVKQAASVVKQMRQYTDAGIQMALNSLDYYESLSKDSQEAVTMMAPSTVGAGMTVITSPRSFVEAATTVANITSKATTSGSKMLLKNMLVTSSKADIIFQHLEEEFTNWADYYKNISSLSADLQQKTEAVSSAKSALHEAVSKLNVAVEAYNSEIAKAEAVLEEREQARKQQVNSIAQARYNDMFFRLQVSDALSRYSQSFDLAQKYAYLAAQAYDYETALLSSDKAAGDAFKARIVAARSLGAFGSDGQPIVGGSGDAGLAGALAEMDANWLVMKPRLGISNPQPYATWFSLRRECFRILPGEEGDAAWAKELSKYWVDDLSANEEFVRHCQPFQSQYGLKDREPGLVIPFATTIDAAKNFFGNDLAGGDSSYDSTWYATRIAAAGLWFDGYNAKEPGYKGAVQLAQTPVAYLVPVGYDRLRAPGLDDGSFLQFAVQDQVVPAPYAVGATCLDDASWVPSMLDGDYAGADSASKIRRHPSFRAYFDPAGGEPDDSKLDATRLVGRSVWNTRWLLVIPAGGLSADREKALSVFINGSDENRDGVRDLKPVSDIRIGFKTYSTSGN